MTLVINVIPECFNRGSRVYAISGFPIKTFGNDVEFFMNPIVLFSLIIFCATVQVWLVLIALSALIPLSNALSAVVWPEWQYMVRPERDALLYHCFVALALTAQAIGIWSVRHKLNQPSFLKAIVPFLTAELVWTALMLNASFKMVVYQDRPGLARDAFIFLSAGALISKLYWPELKGRVGRFYQEILSWPFGFKADLLACAGLIVLLYVPDTKAVLARMFFGDQLHHFDSFMAPAWAFSKGAVLNVDIMTEYGVGTPVMMAWFARLIGFSYSHILWFWMGGTVLYFILCFVFLRRWLGSFALALMGTLLAIKFQMFHSGVTPFIFTFPSATVMRYFWDIIFFLLLLAHLRTLRGRYLFGAAMCCGAQVFCMTTCGYCLTLALVAYLAAFLVLENLRPLVCKNIGQGIGFCSYFAVVPLTTGILLQMTQGGHLWTGEFWNNMQEFNNYFLSGFGLMPMYETIQNKETLAGLMGFFIPVFYMGTFLVTAGLLYWGKAHRDDLMAAILSLYGMAMYHYYLGRSAPTSYYVVCIPYVFILCFWVQRWLGIFKKERRSLLLLTLAAVIVYSLMTNHTYLSYPNLLNVSRNPIVDPLLVQPLPDGRSYFNQSVSKVTEDQKLPENSLGERDEGIKHEKDFKTDSELKKYFDQEFDFSRDAAMIAALTRPSEAVPLLSGFEIKMLMQADRRPFFYYSPILIARPMRMRTFPNSTMYTLAHLKRTMRQLKSTQPEYIFMEKIYLRAPGTKNFQDAYLAEVLNYVFENYAPDQQGRYLVAMKRKD